MIKRGIMEVADAVLVNKADGATEAAATRAAAEYGGCLRLMPHRCVAGLTTFLQRGEGRTTCCAEYAQRHTVVLMQRNIQRLTLLVQGCIVSVQEREAAESTNILPCHAIPVMPCATISNDITHGHAPLLTGTMAGARRCLLSAPSLAGMCLHWLASWPSSRQLSPTLESWKGEVAGKPHHCCISTGCLWSRKSSQLQGQRCAALMCSLLQ
jgi:hypothetical protein